MGAKRYQHVEHAILTLVLRHPDHSGYPTDLPTLASILRQRFPDIADRELVDTLKRLRPQHLTLWKWNAEHGRFLEYPAEIGDDGEFFYRADFRLRHTPNTDPYLQALSVEVDAPESEPCMTQPIDDAGWQAKLDRARGEKEAEAGRPRLDNSLLTAQQLDEANKLLSEVPKGPQDSNVGAWWGRAKNVVECWDSSKSPEGKSAEELFFSNLESFGKGASERRRGEKQMVTLLSQAKHGLELRAIAMKSVTPTPAPTFSRKVFIVHGHDEGARETVARFLEQLGFEPIILHEQASRGRTVIEKVEAHGDVGFAVVLLTPDDEGCEKGGTPRPRARQNVLLELGYFIGRLSRSRVCALKRGDSLEIPSDFGGVVYVPFDDTSGWKQALGRELEAAGFEIDWNKGLGTRRNQ